MEMKTTALLMAAAAAAVAAAVRAEVVTADLVIYGSSPAAVSAAVKAVDMGLKPVVVSPERHVGGLTVSGLGFTDSGNTSSIGGLARQFYHRIYLAYQEPSAWRWERMEDFKAGGQGTKAIVHSEKTMWTFEPHVAERVFAAWLAEKGVSVRRGEYLDRERGVKKTDGRIVSITTLSGNTYRGRYFIDATYEGDLMAAAGVPYRVGRESCSEFGETWNGNQVGVLHHKHHFRDWKVSPYKVPGDLSSGLCALVDSSAPGVRGAGDRRVQAYCYRLCMTDDPRNRIPFEKPSGYDPARYELLARVYAQGYAETFAKFDRIANHKTDTNNHGPVNFDYLGGSYEWPEASYARRAELAKEHRDYQMGLLYFIANDPSVPADVRRAMSKWGLAKDEFADNGGWPYHIYVREGRRMVGAYVMTEHDCLGAPRHPAQGKPYGPVGMGSYSLDSHNVRRYVTAEGFVQNEGDIEVRPKRPYGIDYGAIVPRREACRNLLVPVALSATHTAFGSIRMEPVFMLLGESAATAAALAAEDGRAVQDVSYPALAARLRADGQILELDAAARTKTGCDPTKLEFKLLATRRFMLDNEVTLSEFVPGESARPSLQNPLMPYCANPLPRLAYGKGAVTLSAPADVAAEGVLFVGAFHPGVHFSADVQSLSKGSAAVLCIAPYDGSFRACVRAEPGKPVAFEQSFEGKKLDAKLDDPQVVPAPPFRLSAVVAGPTILIAVRKDGDVRYLGSVALEEDPDIRRRDFAGWLKCAAGASLTPGGTASLTRAAVTLTAGVGQADFRIVTDGPGCCPYMENGRIFCTFSARAGLKYTKSVASFNPSVFDFRMEGILLTSYGDDDPLLRNDGVGHVFRDSDGVWKAIAVGWSTTKHDLNPSSRKGSGLVACESRVNPLHGIHVLRAKPLVVGDGLKSEDPYTTFDPTTNKWRLATSSFTGKGLRACLWESDRWDGPYAQIAGPVPFDSTGCEIMDFGGRKYVMTANAKRKRPVYEYPSLKYVGELRLDFEPYNEECSNGRIFTAFAEMPEGYPYRYILLTMDRQNFPGMPRPNWTYGAMYLYGANPRP